ncbi:chloride channel protein [Ralstonia pseudosolanacearum]|uniref:chloride channel protein n=1 Tax=Ralstonia pseudosolanacearum TaxID=1310165 RepID=UPI0007D7D640|nr:chloride channel protein [Ralstonia pseudosolanacearum]MDC6294016.1 chloride channel protein [Ralstonia pseudosolanacearum]MDD7788913.1 chloride channel protein [Ralstonia pseudosolanacearum]MDN3367845.1 chloride channel protein [Ralstonia pseudosolanacearum]OAK90957.1 chloride channel protein [Ralstonia pseudosolanacearum]QOK87768.1 CBS domain-containing protein [Ralstonia pseudosolanacearum]
MQTHVLRRDFATDTTLFRTVALAAVIAALATVAAAVLLGLIRFFTNLFFFQTLSFADHSPAGNTLGLWVIAVPVIGGLIVGLMARFGSDKIRGHGIPEAIEAILFGKSRMSPRVAVLKPLSSGIVIGSGGPFGAEGPIIMTGGAIGSLLAQCFRLTAAERKTLLVAGATAGMTAVFGTPVAAVLLAVELLLFEWRPRSMLPVAVACAVAGFLRVLVLEPGPLFPLATAPATLPALGSCVIAGLLCGALSRSLSTALYKTEDLFGRLPIHWMWWPALGGLAIGIGGYFEPRALGVGYDVIGDLLHNHLAIRIALALLVVKALIWVIALGSGTSGGVLAPLLMMGAGLGVLLGPVLPGGDPGLWPLVCMAATLAGVLGAPLTAIVFAFGLTHDINAILPALLAVSVAYGFVVLTMPRSIMTEKIARRGFHIYREYAVDPLERHAVDEVMTRTVQTIDAQASVAGILAERFGPTQAHRAFPVVRNGALIGMLDRDALLAGRARGATMIADLFGANAPVMALPGETCRIVATRLAVHGLERLPVVADAQSRRLVGIVSRSDLVKPSVAFFDEEQRRERFRRAPLAGARVQLELRRRRARRTPN